MKALRARRGEGGWLEPLSARHGGTPPERAQRAAESCLSSEGAPLALLLDDLEFSAGESRVLATALIDECIRRREEETPGRGIALIVASSEKPSGAARRYSRLLRALRTQDARSLLRALLRPLRASDAIVDTGVSRCERSPARLRRLAMGLKTEWGPAGVVPDTAEIPPVAGVSSGGGFPRREDLSPLDDGILEALAVLDRPAGREAIARALDLPSLDLRPALRKLARLGAVEACGKGRHLRYQLCTRAAREGLYRRLSRPAVLSVHERMATWLESKGHRTLWEREDLARHLLTLESPLRDPGRREEGARTLPRSPGSQTHGDPRFLRPRT